MKFIDWIKSKKSDIVFLIVALVLVNIVVSGSHLRVDLTKNKSYTITAASKKMLRTLTQPLSVKVFFSQDLPSTYRNTSQFVRDLLFEMKAADRWGNFSYTIFNMNDQDSIKAAQGFGCRQVQIQQVENNEVKLKQAWLSVALVLGDNVATMDSIISEQGFEYKLVTRVEKMAGSLDALAAMSDEDKIFVRLYKSEQLDQFGIGGLGDVEESVRAAVSAVNKKSLGKLTLDLEGAGKEVPLDVAMKAASDYGLQQFNWDNKDGTKGVGFFGLVVSLGSGKDSSGERFRTVPLTIERGLFGYGVAGAGELEDNINSAVEGLLINTTQIGYILGHNEHETYNERGDQNRFTKLLSDTYEFKDLNIDGEDIPSSIKCIIINGPKEKFLDSELYRLDQFVMRGGNLIILADPFDMKRDENNPYAPTTYPPIDNNLNRILTTYGVTLGSALVFDENCFTARQRGGDGSIQSFELFWAPQLTTRELNQKHIITKNLGYVIYLQPGLLSLKDWKEPTLGVKKIDDVTTTVLAVTSANGWTQEKNIQLTPGMGAPYDKSTEKSYPLAVLLEGKFQSAYTEEVDLKTKELDDKEKEKAKNTDSSLTTKTHLTKGLTPAKIFVTATSYVASDQIIDEDGAEPVAMMMRNIVDYMNDREDLCSVRTKGASFETLRMSNGPFVSFIEWFSMVGIAILTIVVALIIWRKRELHKKAIQKKFFSATPLGDGAKGEEKSE